MSIQEANEGSAMQQARPDGVLLADKTAGSDFVVDCEGQVTAITTEGERTTIDITYDSAKEAGQIKELTGLSRKSLSEQVVNNVKVALRKSWKQWNGELKIKASPTSLPGQPNVFPRINVTNPKSLTYVIAVPITTPFEELAVAKQAAVDWLAQSDMAAALPPINVVVQYVR